MSLSICLATQSQEKEARDEMKRRAKELQLARKEATKRGGRGHGYNVGGGFGSADYNPGPSVDMSTSHQPSKPSYNPPRYTVHIWFIHHIILCSMNYSEDRHCIYVIAECMYYNR